MPLIIACKANYAKANKWRQKGGFADILGGLICILVRDVSWIARKSHAHYIRVERGYRLSREILPGDCHEEEMVCEWDSSWRGAIYSSIKRGSLSCGARSMDASKVSVPTVTDAEFPRYIIVSESRVIISRMVSQANRWAV